MRRSVIILSLLSLILLSANLLPARPLSAHAESTSAPPPAKVCHWTTKKVNGKKTRVKVCNELPPADKLATQAVNKLTSARSLGERQTALVSLFGSLTIGVYNSATGKPLVRGAEKSARDFYLYDYELTLLASALQRKEMRPIDDLATILTNMGIKSKGQAVDPTFLRTALQASVKSAMTHTSAPAEALPLVIRELGLHHDQPYDLAQTVPAEKLQFDALQMLLMLADITGPSVHRAAGKTTVRAMTPLLSCKAVNVGSSPFNPNTYLDFFGIHLHYVSDAALAGQISDFVQALTAAENAVGSVNLAYTALMGLHGMLLAYSIKIESLPDLRPSTHYGPAGSNHEADAGKPMVFRARVTMQDDLSEDVRGCLNSAGFSVPQQGPIPGVPVDWHINEGDLEKYGTITYQPSDQKTGKDGIASMVFVPNNETLPGVGTLVTRQGIAEPRALWGMAFENLLGTVNELITPKLGPEFAWMVSYHQPRGFKFSGLKLRWDVYDNCGVVYNPCGYSHHNSYDEFEWSGRVCGEDPFKEPWNIRVHHVYHSGSGSMSATNYDDDIEFDPSGAARLTPDLIHYLFNVTAPGLNDITAPTLRFVPANPMEMRLNLTLKQSVNDTTGFKITPTEQSASVSVVEDTSCPEIE